MRNRLSMHSWLLFMVLAVTRPVGAETIGIRFVVSDALGATAIERQVTRTTLERNVATLNEYFVNSEVNIRAEIVDIGFAMIEERDASRILADMRNERKGFAALFARADEYGADYTFAVMDRYTINGRPGCGSAAAVNRTQEAISSTRNALAVIALVCGPRTLAHELGHLMGLNHGYAVERCTHEQGHALAIAPYANGYAEGACDGTAGPGKFGDVMVGGYMRLFNGDQNSSLPMFSNPRIRDRRCGLREICGDPEIGDAARALNENARYYASHEEPDVHVLRYDSPDLANCIRVKYRGREIVELTELSCPDAGIEVLGGIERLTALTRIDLARNRLRDVSALVRVPHEGIDSIDLSDNLRIPCLQLDRLSARFGPKLIRPVACRRD